MYEVNDPSTPEDLADPYRQVLSADEDPANEDHGDDEPTCGLQAAHVPARCRGRSRLWRVIKR